MDANELIRELPKGIIKWYDFDKGSKVLYVACGKESDNSLQEALSEAGVDVDVVDVHNMPCDFTGNSRYDCVVMVGALEHSKNPEGMLMCLRGVLKDGGKLLMAADNRLGIRYFCGDRDAFTERNFDSIENYIRINPRDMGRLEGRAYARAEIVDMLVKANFPYYRFYSVFPSISNPQVLFADDFIPTEQLDIRIFPQYNSPETIFLNEEGLYSSLIHNGMFHAMANGYFIECPLDGCFNSAMQVTVSMERGRENALCTVIRNDGMVEKKPVYSEGYAKSRQLIDNNDYLASHGVHMVNAVLENCAFVMPYVDGEAATDYFRRIFFSDRELFISELDRFRGIVMGSSEHVPYVDVDWEHFEPNWRKRKPDDPNRGKWKNIAFGSDEDRNNLGVILKRGYIDLVSLNCFYVNGEFIFYDQELYIENLPANAIFKRTIDFIYKDNALMQKQLPISELYNRYNLKEYEVLWNQFTSSFLDNLRNDRLLSSFHRKIRKDVESINANRHRMNYSVDEYERLFRDIFKGTEGRHIYLFGSGNFADKFMDQFGNDCDIAGIIDNNQEKWESVKYGVKIYAPEYLQQLAVGSYKVIICVMNYGPVIKQLKGLGVRDYSVYDAAMIYERKIPAKVAVLDDGDTIPKKYHVGYIAGVFDLFHMGHLNMFKRAKEQCDYLIVGVVTDEGVIIDKKTSPYIPFDERMEIVKSCRYVDEVVGIPVDNPDTYEAYRRYQFDVQFSGSDYENDPSWLAKQTFLRNHGSDMVFFPYTQSTSSTKLKTLIEKKLL